jgi:hypothetical protein
MIAKTLSASSATLPMRLDLSTICPYERADTVILALQIEGIAWFDDWRWWFKYIYG